MTRTCHSILEYIKFNTFYHLRDKITQIGKTFQFYQKTQRYDKSAYGEDTLYTIPSQTILGFENQDKYSLQIQKHHLTTEEALHGLDLFGQQKSYSWWSLDPSYSERSSSAFFWDGTRARRKLPLLMLNIRASELQTVHSRQVYNVLDWLGDVGGLLDGLTVLGGFMMTLYSYLVQDPIESYLLQKLFKTEPKQPESNPLTTKKQILKIKARQPFQVPLFPLCKRRSQVVLEAQGRQRIEKVLDVDHFIKFQMLTKALLRVLLTQAELFLLKNQRQFVLDERTGPSESRGTAPSIDVLDLDSNYFNELLDGTVLDQKPKTSTPPTVKSKKVSQRDSHDTGSHASELRIKAQLLKLDETGGDDDQNYLSLYK